jgi:hypothetical protein
MKALCKTFLLLLAAIALTNCGGGGGGSHSSFNPPGADTITITPGASSISTSTFTTLTVVVKKNDGTAENDGTVVNASLSPTTFGTVSGGATGGGATATNTLSGGKTSFNFNSTNQAGTATITISLPAGLNGNPNPVIQSINITVTNGNTQDPRLQLVPSSATLPVSPFTVGQEQAAPFPGNYPGSPYISDVTLTFRHANGQLVNGTTIVNVSVTPVETISYSTLNTGTGDQFHTLLGSGQVNVTAGVGTIFVHAGQTAGTGILTVTAIDPDSGQTISSRLAITVSGGSSGLPSSVSVIAQGGNVYVTNSGGPQSTVVSALVTDGSNGFVTAPAGVDNVQFTITGPSGTDARLAATNAAGQQITGTSVVTTTSNGVASVTFQAGLQQGPVQVKVTADRGDGNVDNGIQDPVSATATVVVSDGKLESITITNPAINPNLLPVDASVTGAGTATPIYTVPVTVQAEDHQGKAVLAGTSIQFGLIDAPVFGFPDTGSGTFEISGNDGNPQEGGTLFTAPGGAFTTAGGGAHPGDALVLFGKEAPNHVGDDMESARTVQHVNTATSLNVQQAFNLNDSTGISLDSGGNDIPYVIGRSTAGNIDAQAFTGVDANGLPDGRATVNMRYPQSRIGQSAVIWAQGTGDIQLNGVAKTVADAVRLRYLGIGPATLTATPGTIFGNTTQTVTVCLKDAVGSPIRGITINFSFTGIGPGTATADGKTAGTLVHPTGADGCSVTTIVTSGVQPGSNAQIIFTVDDLSATVDIEVGQPVLTALPTQIRSSAGLAAAFNQSASIALLLRDGLGNPVSGASILGSCSAPAAPATATLDAATYITDGNGGATAVVTTAGFCVVAPPPPTSVCTFTYTQGTATATANVTIVGQVQSAFSPICTP